MRHVARTILEKNLDSASSRQTSNLLFKFLVGRVSVAVALKIEIKQHVEADRAQMSAANDVQNVAFALA